MPGKVLAAELPTASGPEAGFFGKLPFTGDFVSRGLPRAFCKNWDAWVTQNLAGRLKDGTIWPDSGLRFRLTSGRRVAAGVIVPGYDAADRPFPLSLILIGADLPGPDGMNLWCNAALLAAGPAQDGTASADHLLEALDQIAAPVGEVLKTNDMLIWSNGKNAIGCDPADPAAAIRHAFATVDAASSHAAPDRS